MVVRKRGESAMAILRDQSKMTHEEMEAKLIELYEENAKLKANSGFKMKVSEKGAISLYGLGRFPVSLYLEQWEKLLSWREQIEEFLVEHAEEITGGEE
jgi:hypothetical protein